ncbi:MAG: polysaccharide pyruvyl transferase family protein [Candidatus Sabulitectum sp.]|nr:polysaccharide pyruvyl transferase family protein [Candidatus Sabulitectum sp.]
MKKVVSFSWGELEAGGSNLGDTVIFKAQFDALSIMGVEIGVLTAEPELTRRRYPGIKCFDVSRGRLGAIISGIKWSDIVIVGGGELVQDVSSLFYSPYNLLPLFLAFLFRRKSFAWAIGIGQGSELAPLTPLLTKAALKACDGITVRDRGSFNVLHKLGFREPEMILAADCALTLSEVNHTYRKTNILGAAPRDVSNRSRKLLPLELRKKLGLHKEVDPLPAADAWADILDTHVDKHGSEIILFPFHTGSLSNDDHEFCDLVRSRMNHASRVMLADPSKPDEFVNLISRCRVLITTPLHGAIISVATGTVPVAISYASKCTRFMEQAELEEYIPSGEAGIPGKTTIATVERAWVNSESIRERMIPLREKLVQRAKRTAEHFIRTFNI